MQGFEGRPHPKGVLNLVQGIFNTHFPTWVDVQTLLNILLSGEEKALIMQLMQGRKQIRPIKIMQGRLYYQPGVQAIPEMVPEWDH